MANKIFKGLAVAAGTGLAIGLGSNRRRNLSPDNILALEPLLNRLDGIEDRVGALEISTQEASTQAASTQSAALDALQVKLTETRQRLAAEVAIFEQRFAQITGEIPALLESLLTPRIQDLRTGLRTETEEMLERSLASFERLIDSKVALRMSTIERAIIDQSGVISALSQRAIDSDSNMQRLIGAVERLCERSPADLPFERHLNEAIKRNPDNPPPPPDTGFKPRLATEDDIRNRRRTPLSML